MPSLFFLSFEHTTLLDWPAYSSLPGPYSLPRCRVVFVAFYFAFQKRSSPHFACIWGMALIFCDLLPWCGPRGSCSSQILCLWCEALWPLGIVPSLRVVARKVMVFFYFLGEPKNFEKNFLPLPCTRLPVPRGLLVFIKKKDYPQPLHRHDAHNHLY